MDRYWKEQGILEDISITFVCVCVLARARRYSVERSLVFMRGKN